MASITIGQCIKGAWRDGMLAIIERPVFTLAIFSLLLGISSLQIDLHSHAAALTTSAVPGRLSVSDRWLQLACGLMRIVLICCLTIHVIRYTLLGLESPWPRWLVDGTLWRYVRLNVVIGIIAALIIAVLTACGIGVAALLVVKGVHAGRSPTVIVVTVLLLALGCFFAFAMVRLSLLFCHTAIGRRTTWRAAWSDTRGHVWAMVGTHVLTSLPIMLPLLLVFVLSRRFLDITSNDNSFTSWLALGQTLWVIVGISIGAASSAWLYRRFAAGVLEAR